MQAELSKLLIAIEDFYAHEAFLLERDLGERTLTHRLAVHVERRFPGWQVDCDYSHLGERLLRLPHGTIVSTDDTLGKSIYPDIVVHQRAVPLNLLAIELRKATNHQPLGHDQDKLKALTDPHLWFAFASGVLLTLAGKNGVTCEAYTGGGIDSELTTWLAGRLRSLGLSAR